MDNACQFDEPRKILTELTSFNNLSCLDFLFSYSLTSERMALSCSAALTSSIPALFARFSRREVSSTVLFSEWVASSYCLTVWRACNNWNGKINFPALLILEFLTTIYFSPQKLLNCGKKTNLPVKFSQLSYCELTSVICKLQDDKYILVIGKANWWESGKTNFLSKWYQINNTSNCQKIIINSTW